MAEQGGVIGRLGATWHRWDRTPNARLAVVGIALWIGPSAMLACLIASLKIVQSIGAVDIPDWPIYISLLCIVLAGLIGTIVSPLVIAVAIWGAIRDSRRRVKSPALNPEGASESN